MGKLLWAKREVMDLMDSPILYQRQSIVGGTLTSTGSISDIIPEQGMI